MYVKGNDKALNWGYYVTRFVLNEPKELCNCRNLNKESWPLEKRSYFVFESHHQILCIFLLSRWLAFGVTLFWTCVFFIFLFLFCFAFSLLLNFEAFGRLTIYWTRINYAAVICFSWSFRLHRFWSVLRNINRRLLRKCHSLCVKIKMDLHSINTHMLKWTCLFLIKRRVLMQTKNVNCQFFHRLIVKVTE